MRCPVCGNDTFVDSDYEYAICSECFWEYDLIQVENPDYSGGANNHSLNAYREIYKRLKEDNPSFSCQNKEDRELIVRLDHEDE